MQRMKSTLYDASLCLLLIKLIGFPSNAHSHYEYNTRFSKFFLDKSKYK